MDNLYNAEKQKKTLKDVVDPYLPRKKDLLPYLEYLTGATESKDKSLWNLAMAIPIAGGSLRALKNPWRSIKKAKFFEDVYYALKSTKFGGHWGKEATKKFGMSEREARSFLFETSEKYKTPPGKLMRFARQKISGTKPAIKENRKYAEEYFKKHGKWPRSIDNTRFMGGWEGGKSIK
jgi:predicted CopG family antitoxin